jgi:hypothetical protein
MPVNNTPAPPKSNNTPTVTNQDPLPDTGKKLGCVSVSVGVTEGVGDAGVPVAEAVGAGVLVTLGSGEGVSVGNAGVFVGGGVVGVTGAGVNVRVGTV